MRAFLIDTKSINLKSIIKVNQNKTEINIINIKDKIMFNLTKKSEFETKQRQRLILIKLTLKIVSAH